MGRETQACRNRGRVPTEIDRERRKSCFVKKVSGEGRGSCLVGSIQGNLHEEGWLESPLGRDDGLGVRRDVMIGSIQYICLRNYQAILQLFYVQGGGSRAETGGEAWGLDEVEMLVSDEGGFDNAWL